MVRPRMMPSRGPSLLLRRSQTSLRGLKNPAHSASPENPVIIGPQGVEEVKIGDTVSLDYSIRSKDGEEVQSSTKTGPMTFEVGVGQSVQNPLFQGIDQEVLGLKVGDCKSLSMSGPDWNPDLLFKVPFDHPEIERLQRRYSAQGGLIEGEYVELVNGDTALVVKADKDTVTLDCNSAFAGNAVTIDIKVVNIEYGDGSPKAYRPPTKV